MQIDVAVTFIGLPNVGKSLIYNLVTGQQSEVSPYPISTAKPVHCVIDYADLRMSLIASIIEPSELFLLKLKFADIGGITPGLSQGKGGAAEALGSMRSSDVLCHVIRAFDDPSVPHPYSGLDFERDVNVVLVELCAADRDLLNARIARLESMIRRGQREKALLSELELLKTVLPSLELGHPLFRSEWSEHELGLFNGLSLITHKPQFYMVNYGEDHISRFCTTADWKHEQPFQNNAVVAVCGQLESEILQLEPEEKREFLDLYAELELTSDQIPSLALRAADRITYFTFGHLGLKQWSVPRGTTVIGAAKRLHTDLANRFIAAEVMTVDGLLEAGSVDALKSQGRVRLEGREYTIQDGDIFYFRFGR